MNDYKKKLIVVMEHYEKLAIFHQFRIVFQEKVNALDYIKVINLRRIESSYLEF